VGQGTVTTVTLGSNIIEACRGWCPREMYTSVIQPKLNVH
jgi:hypothetical protein